MNREDRIKELKAELERLENEEFLPIPGQEWELAETPVTCSQYAEFLQVVKIPPPSYWTDGKIPPGKEDHPVVFVSSREADLYAAWLAWHTGEEIAVASEAVWKAACGDKRYPWGDASLDRTRAQYEANDTAPVDAHPAGAGPYGHLGLLGNVWEIMQDKY